MTLLSSQASPRDAQADAIIIGVVQGPDGPLPAPGAEDVDQAMERGLATTLSVLGATGKAEEVTKIASAGRLAAPLIVAVGIGPACGEPPADGEPAAAGDAFAAGQASLDGRPSGASFDEETLRRAAGAAVRALAAAKPRHVALALPARTDAEAE